jgi:hypothetical protein
LNPFLPSVANLGEITGVDSFTDLKLLLNTKGQGQDTQTTLLKKLRNGNDNSNHGNRNGNQRSYHINSQQEEGHQGNPQGPQPDQDQLGERRGQNGN